MTQFVVKRLVSGRKIVKMEVADQPSVQAWFEPCEHSSDRIDFKVNGISTTCAQGDVMHEQLDDFASKWLDAFGRDGEIDSHGRVSYIKSSTRESLLKQAQELVAQTSPEHITGDYQFVGDFEAFVSNVQ